MSDPNMTGVIGKRLFWATQGCFNFFFLLYHQVWNDDEKGFAVFVWLPKCNGGAIWPIRFAFVVAIAYQRQRFMALSGSCGM